MILEWKTSEYFSVYDLRTRDVVLGIRGGTRFILGANWMINKDIFFNLE